MAVKKKVKLRAQEKDPIVMHVICMIIIEILGEN